MIAQDRIGIFPLLPASILAEIRLALHPVLSAAKGLQLDWSICAFGHHELACAAHAQKLGGHIRIGFENNLELPNGTPARDNAQLISLAIAQGNSLGLNPTQQNGDRHEPHFSAPQ